MKVEKTASILIIIFAIVYLLIIAQNIIIPIILSLLLWFLIKEIREFFDKIKWIKKHIPRWVKTVFASFLLLGAFALMANMVVANIKSMNESVGLYEKNFFALIQSIESKMHFSFKENIQKFTKTIDLKAAITTVLNSFVQFFSDLSLVVIYLIFILLEERIFRFKIRAITDSKEQYQKLNSMLQKIDKSVGSYIGIKTLLSFIKGSLSYVALLLIGIDFALFWAFLLFVLNYIPFGSLFATIFPALMALVQFGETTYLPFIFVVAFVGLIQVVVENFLEPKLMGDSLNISSLIVIIALTLWASIWGVAGMVLAIPITVISIIILSHFEKTKKIAILLSERGRISK